MKTETLIELQRSITQGEWRLNNCQRTGMALIEDSKGGDIAICDEGFPQYNARAIALVPELIAEVVRLREENEALTRKLDIAYNGLTTVKKITDGSQPKDYPSVPTVAAYVLGELA